VVFVAKHAAHRFHSIAEELTLLVFFAPAESSEPEPSVGWPRASRTRADPRGAVRIRAGRRSAPWGHAVLGAQRPGAKLRIRAIKPPRPAADAPI